MTYHGFSDHVFQTGSQDTQFDSELSKALCHKAEEHVSGILKHWQHANKVIIQNDFLNDSFKTMPLKWPKNGWHVRAEHVPFDRGTGNDRLETLPPLSLLTAGRVCEP